MLVDNNYNLRLTNFEQSYDPIIKRIKGRGTKNYRAPELKEGEDRVEDPTKCDIFSAGVFLFVMFTRGMLPFTENKGGLL